MLLFDRGRKPRRLDLFGFDTRVGERLLIGFDDEVLSLTIPALTEFRAAMPRMATLSRMPVAM
jgi:hypothetical protein